MQSMEINVPRYVMLSKTAATIVSLSLSMRVQTLISTGMTILSWD